MKSQPLNIEILDLIRKHAGKPTQHTFLNSYLGTAHPRYPISIPILRKIAREWMRVHRELTAIEFKNVLTGLIHAPSNTEKIMAGILLDLSKSPQQKFDPHVFDDWLEHLEGWAEVDALCTGKYTSAQIQTNFPVWKKILVAFSKSTNIHKRRASIVLCCSPLRKGENLELATLATQNVSRLKGGKEILITKAISWVLRSAVKHHKALIKKYVQSNKDTLPKIAIRETMAKITTGRKTKPKH